MLEERSFGDVFGGFYDWHVGKRCSPEVQGGHPDLVLQAYLVLPRKNKKLALPEYIQEIQHLKYCVLCYLPQGQECPGDPLGQVFLQVPVDQLALFFQEPLLHQVHPGKNRPGQRRGTDWGWQWRDVQEAKWFLIAMVLHRMISKVKCLWLHREMWGQQSRLPLLVTGGLCWACTAGSTPLHIAIDSGSECGFYRLPIITLKSSTLSAS